MAGVGPFKKDVIDPPASQKKGEGVGFWYHQSAVKNIIFTRVTLKMKKDTNCVAIIISGYRWVTSENESTSEDEQRAFY